MKTMTDTPEEPFDFHRAQDLYRQQYRAMLGNTSVTLRQVQSAPVDAIRSALALRH